jgi:GINS complex subunit 2
MPFSHARTCHSAEEDIESSEEVRRLLQDITDIRQSKTRQGLENIKSALVVNVRNLTPMEINSVRPFFAASMDTFFRIHQFSNPQGE